MDDSELTFSTFIGFIILFIFGIIGIAAGSFVITLAVRFAIKINF